ncbi:hypothetical protein GCM10020220_008040 [Nonomuraea rubra]
MGCGRLGAMVFGGVATERLQLNEDSIWPAGRTTTTTRALWRRCRRSGGWVWEDKWQGRPEPGG